MSDPKTILTITHSAAEGTLLEGSRKGDGAWEAIKQAQAAYKIQGWKFFYSISAIGIRSSRDKPAQMHTINATAEILRATGRFEVEIEVDNTPRAMEDVEADRAERMDDRADALHAKASRRTAAADSRHQAAKQAVAGIEPGQPILAGHHSERRHRRDLARHDTNMRASIALAAEAETATQRAEAAEKHMARREDPRRVLRRIETLKADRRRVQRGIDGYTNRHLDHSGQPFYVDHQPPATGDYRKQLDDQATHLDEQIRYWEKFIAGEITAGRFNPVDLSAIKPGDEIRYWGGWQKVLKVNKVTVKVESRHGGSHNVKVDEIFGHRPAPPAGDVLDLDEVQGEVPAP